MAPEIQEDGPQAEPSADGEAVADTAAAEVIGKEDETSAPVAANSEQVLELPDVPTKEPTLPGEPESKRRKVESESNEAASRDEA
jgi:hypothetical protein